MALHAIVRDKKYRSPHNMHTARHNRSRSISASICLLVVVLLYAPLAGARWSSYRSACCTSGQCPIPAHHHQKTPAEHANHMRSEETRLNSSHMSISYAVFCL